MGIGQFIDINLNILHITLQSINKNIYNIVNHEKYLNHALHLHRYTYNYLLSYRLSRALTVFTLLTSTNMLSTHLHL